MGLAVLTALWIGNYFCLAIVQGSSMEPTLFPGAIVVVKLGVLPQRGDIVVIQSEKLDRRIIKRVIAAEGDAVLISGDKIWLNGSILEENYLKGSYESVRNFVVVPTQSYYVLGDNRDYSRDSRMIGVISDDEVVGVVKMSKK
ncbi:MAG: signal peptidase I [Hungatella sp.]|nr:signal peptidase I [Hungatella sp.]